MKTARPHQITAEQMIRASLKSGKRRPMLDDLNLPAIQHSMENWKAIPGYEGLYEASDLGRVRSLPRIVNKLNRWGTYTDQRFAGRMMVLNRRVEPTGKSRLDVKLSKNGFIKGYLVHRLIMLTFVGPCPEGMEVAHNDGISDNNALSNLRYDTPMNNTHDKFRHGTMLRGEQIVGSKLTEAQAREIKALKGRERLWETAARFGIQQPQVSRIQNGLRWAWLA